MIFLNFFSIIMLFLFSSVAFAFDLKNGLASGEGNWSVLTKTDRDAGYYPKAVVESNEDGVVYIFDGSIGKTNYKENKFLGGWPLHHFGYEYLSPLVEEQYRAIDISFDLPLKYEIGHRGPGCMGYTPLRYGDIEGDGDNELVFTIGGSFLIFSPTYERVVFSAYVQLTDLLSPETFKSYFGDQTFPDAQYLSLMAKNNGYPVTPALRYYAKIYQGDFDQDGNPDLLVWRKGYLSRRGDDAVKGYELKEEVWEHYERDLKAQAESEAGVKGNYIPQQADEATIQAWLSENELTWSKGYPSKSECAGEEGQLIPEMHDPLLNDPDVLK